jgi:YgiT-type zinc finger domain-containing protein
MMPFGKCLICGGDLGEKQVEKLVRGGRHAAVLKVRAEVCLHCGERLYSEETVKLFEQIRGVMGALLPTLTYLVGSTTPAARGATVSTAGVRGKKRRGSTSVIVVESLHARRTATGCPRGPASCVLGERDLLARLVEEDQYALAALRYLGRNPVRAGFVEDPATYPWSSCAAYAPGTPNRLAKSQVSSTFSREERIE